MHTVLRSSFSTLDLSDTPAWVHSVLRASVEHRDYYIDHDPVHIAFTLLVKPLLEKVVVTDFIDGVWN